MQRTNTCPCTESSVPGPRCVWPIGLHPWELNRRGPCCMIGIPRRSTGLQLLPHLKLTASVLIGPRSPFCSLSTCYANCLPHKAPHSTANTSLCVPSIGRNISHLVVNRSLIGKCRSVSCLGMSVYRSEVTTYSTRPTFATCPKIYIYHDSLVSCGDHQPRVHWWTWQF